MSDEVLAVEARLKDYITSNLKTLEGNMRQFSETAKRTNTEIQESIRHTSFVTYSAQEMYQKFGLRVVDSTKKIDDGVKGSKNLFDQFGVSSKAMGGAVVGALSSLINPATMAAGAVLGISFAFNKALNDAYAFATQMDDLAQKTGASTDYLQKLNFVGVQVGASVQSLGMAFKALSVNITNAGEDQGKSSDLLRALGISAKDAAGNMRGVSDIMNDALIAIAKLPDVTTRAAAAQVLFGRGSMDLLPIINQGAEAIQNSMKQAEDLGIVIRDKTIKQIDGLDDATKRMKISMNTAGAEMMAAFAPPLTWITDKITELFALLNKAGKLAHEKRYGMDLNAVQYATDSPLQGFSIAGESANQNTPAKQKTPEQIAKEIAEESERVRKILAQREKEGKGSGKNAQSMDDQLAAIGLPSKANIANAVANAEALQKYRKEAEEQIAKDKIDFGKKAMKKQEELTQEEKRQSEERIRQAQREAEQKSALLNAQGDMTYNLIGLGAQALIASRAQGREQQKIAAAAAIIQGNVAAGFAIAKVWQSAKSWQEGVAESIAIGAGITASTIAIASQIKAQKFAAGTRSAPGGMAMVGEFGPEMMYVPQGARIYNNNETRNMFGGNSSVNVTLNIAGGAQISPRDTDRITRSVEDLAKDLNRSIRNGRITLGAK